MSLVSEGVIAARHHGRMDPGIAVLAGAGIGLLGALLASGLERVAAERREMRRAYGAYVGSLYPPVGELLEMPPDPPLPWAARLLDRWRDEAATWAANQKARRKVLGDRPLELGDRVAAAYAQLQMLPLPASAKDAVDLANDYFERLSRERTEAVKSEWPSIHDRLIVAKVALAPRWRRALTRRRGSTT